MLPWSISTAGSVLVGNYLGEGNAKKAKRAAISAGVLGCSLMLINAAIMFFGRNHLGYIYTNNENVVQVTSTLFPIAGLFQIFDGEQTVLSGVLNGMAKAKLVAIFNGIGYYLLALPFGIVLTFPFGFGLGRTLTNPSSFVRTRLLLLCVGAHSDMLTV